MKRVLFLIFLALPLAARMRAVRSAPDVVELRGVRVIALGDVTHGTHETYAFKRAIAPRLVEEGFRTFAFEAPYAMMKRVDDYVVSGIGNPREALDVPRYWFWDTDEIVELIEWMRAQNASGLTPSIRVAGLDPTSPQTTTAEVIAFLRVHDPAYAEEAEMNYACMLGPRYQGTDACRALVLQVRQHIEAKGFDEIAYAARMVEQEERVIVGGLDTRDPFMAENVLALDGKVVIFGHNEHFGQTPYVLRDTPVIKSAGAYLVDALDVAYFSIGTIVSGGTFHAVEYSGAGGFIRVQTLNPPSSDDDVAVLLRDARELVPMRVPFTGVHRMRFAASAVKSSTETVIEVDVDLAKKFDAVVFIKTSTPNRVRHFPTF
ncbi:MAG: erythromycin esterase family protein [Thermoanaerobaculia bacterium]